MRRKATEDVEKKRTRKRQKGAQVTVSKADFEATLKKVFTTPVRKSAASQEGDQGPSQTSESRPSGDCSGTRRNQDTTEGKEG